MTFDAALKYTFLVSDIFLRDFDPEILTPHKGGLHSFI